MKNGGGRHTNPGALLEAQDGQRLDFAPEPLEPKANDDMNAELCSVLLNDLIAKCADGLNLDLDNVTRVHVAWRLAT